MKHRREGHKVGCRIELHRAYMESMMRHQSSEEGDYPLRAGLAYYERLRDLFLLKWRVPSLIEFVKSGQGQESDIKHGFKVWKGMAYNAQNSGRFSLAYNLSKDLYEVVHEVTFVLEFDKCAIVTFFYTSNTEAIRIIRKYLKDREAAL